MKKNYILYTIMLSIMLIFTGCVDHQKLEKDISSQNTVTPSNRPDSTVESVPKDKNINWNSINIPVSDFFGEKWGGTLVQNSKYCFYFADNNIIRLDKKSHKRIEIIKFENQENSRIILYLADEQLYYVNQVTNDIYCTDFSGKGKEHILSNGDLKKYDGVMENTEILGVHIHKGEMYILLSAYEIVHYDIKQKKLKNLAYDVRNGCFIDNSFYYVKRPPSPVYVIELGTNKVDIVKKSKSYEDLYVFDNKLYYVNREKIYRYSKNKKDSLFFELSNGQEFIQFVPSADVISFIYWENDDLYLSWKKDTEKNWNDIILPEEFYAAYGIIDGVFFYEAVDLKDEEEVLPFYKAMPIFEY